MTQVRARRGTRDNGNPAIATGSPYLQLLRSPGALAFSSSAFVGRMSMSMYGLGTILLIATTTGRYGLAGIVAAAGSIGYAVFGPLIAQQADRLGQRRVLLAQAAVFAVSSTAFIGSVELHAPFWVELATGAVAGASMPSVGNMVRTRWSALVGTDARRLHTAFALESVNDELIFVVGPALVTLLATEVFPASGIGLAVILCLTGTLVFAAQRSTEPAPRPRQPARERTPGRAARFRRPEIPAAGLTTLAPAFLLLGAMFASIDLSTVAFATELGHRPEAGLILGSYALGSAAGGLWYGSRHWIAPIGRRFTMTMAFTAAGMSTFWLMPGLLALAGVGFLAAMAVAPTLMTGYAILERQAAEHRRTEAMAWLGSTVSVGVALGSALAGRIIDADGPRWGFGFAASCGAVAVLICLAGLGRLRTQHDRAAAEVGMTA
jgi:MFS family permease